MTVLSYYLACGGLCLGAVSFSPVFFFLGVLLGLYYLFVLFTNENKLSNLKRDLGLVKIMVGFLIYLKLLDRKTDGKTTLPDFLKFSDAKNAKKIALVFIDHNNESHSFTFKDLEESSNRVANWSLSIGLKPGNTVGLVMDNCPDLVFLIFGFMKVGVAVALINPNVKDKGLEHSIRVCGCRNVLYWGDTTKAKRDSRNLEIFQNVERLKSSLFEESAKQVNFIQYMGLLSEKDYISLAKETTGILDPINGADRLFLKDHSLDLSESLQNEIRNNVRFLDTALHIFTSGTTGLPKAARIHHQRIYGGAYVFGNYLGSNCDTKLYCTLPMYHSSAFILGLCQSLLAGGCFVVRSKFSASQFWKDCCDHDINTIMYIGEMCRYLVNSPPSEFENRHKVKIAFGNGLRPDVWRKFVDRFHIPKILEFYASTEGNANLINTENKFGAIGFISEAMKKAYPVRVVRYDPDTEAPYRNEKGFCEDVPCGEAGEIIGLITDAPHMKFDGYTDKQATQKKIIINVFKQGDKYFTSGDLVKLDENGYVYFVDRIGDTFRFKGENVSTAEVADTISSVVSAFEEITVYGVSINDESEGKAGMASVYCSESIEFLDFSKIFKSLNENLPFYAVPCFLKVTERKKAGKIEGDLSFDDGLEVTATFKHKKLQLVKDGYDPSIIVAKPVPPLSPAGDNKTKGSFSRHFQTQLFYKDLENQTYSTLNSEIYERIRCQDIRL